MNRHEKWRAELVVLKDIIEKADLTRTTKWGADVYTRNGINTVSYGGFNDFFALWFFHGVYLKDPYGVLINAQEGKTKALRQWRFTSIGEVDEAKIVSYVEEAINNVDNGLIWQRKPSEAPVLPQLLLDWFESDQEVRAAFEAFTPYKRKEFIEYLNAAKTESTRIRRLERIKSMSKGGAGLHESY